MINKHKLNIYILSLCFSFVEAALLVVLSLSTAVNHSLGEISSGLLYISYTLTGLISPAFVWRYGVKKSIIFSLSCFMLYIVANVYPLWITLLPTSILAGIGASILWTSLGTYITKSAELYSLEMNNNNNNNNNNDDIEYDTSHVLGRFNGIFFFIFESIVVLSQSGSSLFLSGGLIKSSSNPSSLSLHLTYAFFSILSFLSILTLTYILPNLPLTDDDIPPPLKQQFKSTTLLIIEDKRMQLMILSNMAFGFIQGFQNSTFARHIIKKVLGTGNIGILASISALSGALTAVPFGRLSDYVGRLPIMSIGFIAHLLMTIILLFFYDSFRSISYESDDNDWFTLIFLSMLFGIGNCVWNTQNSAVFGDFFTNSKRPAFANLKMHSGFATAVSFFLFPHILIDTQLWLIAFVLVSGFICYLFARYIHKSKYTRVLSEIIDHSSSTSSLYHKSSSNNEKLPTDSDALINNDI